MSIYCMSMASLIDTIKSNPFQRLLMAADGSIASVWKTSPWLKIGFRNTELLWTDCHLHTFPKHTDYISLLVMIHPIFTITSACIILSKYVFILTFAVHLLSLDFRHDSVAWPQSGGATYFSHFCGYEKVPQILPHFQSYLPLALSLYSSVLLIDMLDQAFTLHSELDQFYL